MPNPYDIANRFGIKHPLANYGNPSADNSTGDPQLDDVNKANTNYQTRLQAIGQTAPKPENGFNKFLKVLALLDRPRAAVWNSIHDTVTGEDNPVHAFTQGLTGKDNYSGANLVKDWVNGSAVVGGKLSGKSDERIKEIQNQMHSNPAMKAWEGVLGFASEVVGDPLNAVTFGVGSGAKGAITGTAKTLGKEGATAAARAGLKGVTVEKAIKDATAALTKGGKVLASPDEITNLAKSMLHNDAGKVLADHVGAALPKADLFTSADDVLKHAHNTYAAETLANEGKMAGRGLSIGTKNHNISFISNTQLQDAGAAASNWVKDNVPVAGKVLGGAQDIAKKIFDPTYINGLDDVTSKMIYKFKRNALGTKNVADAATVKQFDNFTKALGKLGVKAGGEQDALIGKVLEGTAKAEELHADAGKIFDTLKQSLLDMGHKEADIGVLKSELMDNYMPHVANWEGKVKPRKGGLTERMKFDNPANRRRMHGDTLDDAQNSMLFNTSSLESRESFINGVYGLAGKQAPGKFPNANEFTKLIKEHKIGKDALKPLYDQLDGVPNYFETSAVKSWMTRALSHNKMIADKEFFDNVTSAFGTKIENSKAMQILQNQGKDIIIPRSSLSIFKISNAHDGIEINKAFKEAGKTAKKTGMTADLGDDIEATIAKMPKDAAAVIKKLITDSPDAMIKVTPDDLAALERSGMFGKYNIIEAYAVAPGVVGAINKGAGRQIDAGLDAILKTIDKVYSIWKPTVTGLNPAYHTRNAVGGTINNAMDIGMRAFDPTLHADAIAITRGVDKELTIGGQKFTAAQIREAMLRTHANTNLQINEFADRQASLANKYNTNVGGTNAITKTIASAKANPLTTIAKPGAAVGKAIESEVRTVNYLANLDSALADGMSREQAIQYAGDQVRKYQFDYSELTTAEREVFRRIAPFYSWMRKNLPLQLENALNNPASITMIPKYQRNMNESMGTDTSEMPAWFANQLPIPLPIAPGADGKARFANISAPQTDLNKLDPATMPKELVNMLSPAIKLLFESASNQSMLTGAPIYKNKHEATAKLFENVVNQFGVGRDMKNALTNAISPKDEAPGAKAVSKGVLGSATIDKVYDPVKAHKDAMYQYNRDLGNEVQYQAGKMADGKVPDTATAEVILKQHPELADVIKRTGIIPQYILNAVPKKIVITQDAEAPNYADNGSGNFRSRYLEKIKGKMTTFDNVMSNYVKGGGL